MNKEKTRKKKNTNLRFIFYQEVRMFSVPSICFVTQMPGQCVCNFVFFLMDTVWLLKNLLSHVSYWKYEEGGNIVERKGEGRSNIYDRNTKIFPKMFSKLLPAHYWSEQYHVGTLRKWERRFFFNFSMLKWRHWMASKNNLEYYMSTISTEAKESFWSS